MSREVETNLAPAHFYTTTKWITYTDGELSLAPKMGSRHDKRYHTLKQPISPPKVYSRMGRRSDNTKSYINQINIGYRNKQQQYLLNILSIAT